LRPAIVGFAVPKSKICRVIRSRPTAQTIICEICWNEINDIPVISDKIAVFLLLLRVNSGGNNINISFKLIW